MADITLFHSVCGLRPAVLDDAERLRAAGHRVQTPDLFDGAVFDEIDSGMAHLRTLDRDALQAKAFASVADVGAGHVYGGYSLGAAYAQLLVEGRPDAGGGLLLAHADKPWTVDQWPPVPTQAHVARDDEYVDDAAGAAAAGLEVFTYDGGHLFMDPGLAGHDAASTALLWERVLAFLDTVG
jgi:dienelactone hydrolase